MHIDEGAVAAVMVELKWEPALDASRIRVFVADGVVFLRGKVGSLAEKLAASRAALRAPGVRYAHNEIEVDPRRADRRTDEELRTAALQALEWEAQVPDGLIEVEVSKGFVTLRGVVTTPLEVDAAQAAIRRIAGLVGLRNELRLGGPVL